MTNKNKTLARSLDTWFSETYGDTRLGWRIHSVKDVAQSKFQSIAVVETVPFGKMLVIDGCVMTTEKDEFVYHEMLVHPILLAHSRPERVCVIGGGDGGTIREVLLHPEVKTVALVELDEVVVKICREHFKSHTQSLDDPRVAISFADGFEFLKSQKEQFDVILSDSIDPVGPGESLFSDDYFQRVKDAMGRDGIFATQAGPYWNSLDILQRCYSKLRKHFRIVRWYSAPIPTYPTGSWSFFAASDTVDPLSVVNIDRQTHIVSLCQYYTKEHQSSAFVMPAFVKKALLGACEEERSES